MQEQIAAPAKRITRARAKRLIILAPIYYHQHGNEITGNQGAHETKVNRPVNADNRFSAIHALIAGNRPARVKAYQR
jgi:hypothetical protein